MKGEDVGPVLVIEDKSSRRLVGIVTDRDLALKVVAAGKDPNSVRVKEVMTTARLPCGRDDNIKKTMERMKDNQVRRIPVVDKDECVLGIISQADIAREVGDEEVGEVVEDVSDPARERTFSPAAGDRITTPRMRSGHGRTRLAIAAAGGGLLVYGIRSSGRTRQIATTAGAALVARGLTGKPFEGLGDLMNPAKAFGF